MERAIFLLLTGIMLTQLSYSQCEITGQVYYGGPLEKGVGATVREMETKTGVLVGNDGYFTYTSSSNKKFTIQFSYEGMEPVEYVFDGSKYSNYQVRVNLFPKAKAFKKQKKSYVSVKQKTRKPVTPADNVPPAISMDAVEENNENLRRAALIIGNADYRETKLVNTLNDANDLGEKLQSFGFELFKYKNIENKADLENAIVSFFQKVKNYDIVVFYYSGHGVQVNGENYMLPTQVTLNSEEVVKSYCVDINSVLNEMKGAQCKYKVIILDACRDNPFEKMWAAKSLKNNGKGLSAIGNSTNTLVMFATSPGAIASDNHAGRNSLFTQELLKNMDKDLSIDQIFKLTGKGVADISANCQVPWISSSLFDDVYLKR